MIYLNETHAFAKGSDRVCYNFPLNNNKIIKIPIGQNTQKTNQNDLELNYYNYLKKKNIKYTHISKCFGEVDTNLGKGLVFEKIQDYNKQTSLTYREMLIQESLTENTEKILLDDLKNYIFENNILFIDCTTVNIVYKKLSESKSRLVIIDGLGAKKLNFKYYLYKYCYCYRKYKISKQWEVFLLNIKKVKNKISLNQKL